MIHYDLRCAHGHTFDGWFASSAAFEKQAERGILECPVCGARTVERALMTPALGKGPPARPSEADAACEHETACEADAACEHETARKPETPDRTASEQTTPVALTDERSVKLRAAAEAFRRAVAETGVDVGRAFPQEARKIHYGETEARSIYGQAGEEEVRALLDEGIEVLPLPGLGDKPN